ncbi:MAG: glycerophosphodiester phosphodiesterase [Spirochaetes bacterium]|nr:glycerophosphodiester phosphodiesterase [Spirochaetota bacterium]
MRGEPAVFIRGLGKFTPVAHRGASTDFPENTVPAFRRALEIAPGCILETDVRKTLDGGIMIMHDGLLESNTDGCGPAAGLPAAEIKKLDAGYNISFDGGKTRPFRGRGFVMPSLEEVLEEFPDSRFSIDVKDDDPDFADRVASLVSRMGAGDRVVLASFHEAVSGLLRKRHPSIARCFSRREVIRFYFLHRLCLAGFFRGRDDGMFIPEFTGPGLHEYQGEDAEQGTRLVTRRFIADAHSAGIPVFAWTINMRENMQRLMEWGIDGIVTDRLHLLKEVMDGAGISR